MSQGTTPAQEEKVALNKGVKRIIIFAILITLFFVISYQFEFTEKLSMKYLRDQLELLREWANRPYGPLLFFGISVAAIVFHLPELVVIIIGGLVYNFWTALILTWLSSCMGITLTFLISRYFLREFVRPILERSFLRSLDERLRNGGFTVIAVLRLLMGPIPLLNWLPGATSIRTGDYIVGSAVGVGIWLVPILLTTSKLLEAESFADLLRPDILIIVAPCAVMIVVLQVLRRRFFPHSKDKKP